MPVRLVLAAALVLLAPLGATAQGVILEGRRCATPEPTVAEALSSARIVASYRAGGAFLRAAAEPVTVPVAVHVIRAGQGVAQGNVPDAWIAAQIDTLNSAFADMGYRFALALVERVDNAEWYEDLGLGSAEEAQMKRALALDPARVLNLYTVSPGLDYLGWASLPDGSAERDVDQGVVLLDQSLPGGSESRYNLGHTGTHEVGHWVGLNHTFAGGCTEPNDGVGDTPQQRVPTPQQEVNMPRCPTPAPDSCPLDPGLDPIHNYMDYSDDACMTQFTSGQIDRAEALMNAHRPTLLAGGYALAMLPRGALDGLFVGVPATAPLRVTNTTSAPLTVTGVTADGAEVALAGGPVTVPPGEAARLDLEVLATRTGSISLAVLTDGVAPEDLGLLRGTASLPPTARLAQSGVQATVIEGGTIERTVTLANDGDGPLSFEIDLDRLPRWVLRAEPAAGVVPPHGETTITFTLAAFDLAAADYAETVEIATNDPFQGVAALAFGLEVLVRPAALAVGSAYPNPGRGLVTIPVELPNDLDVRVDVVDVRGRVVAVLADGLRLSAGYPELTWDASRAAPGVYLVRARTSSESAVGRLVIAR